jgi:hypothetical protein
MSKYSTDKWIMEFETIQFQFRGDLSFICLMCGVDVVLTRSRDLMVR